MEINEHLCETRQLLWWLYWLEKHNGSQRFSTWYHSPQCEWMCAGIHRLIIDCSYFKSIILSCLSTILSINHDGHHFLQANLFLALALASACSLRCNLLRHFTEAGGIGEPARRQRRHCSSLPRDIQGHKKRLAGWHQERLVSGVEGGEITSPMLWTSLWGQHSSEWIFGKVLFT